ncbi:hypothetical protein K0M31_014070 [Melipona bicolor]|uniref:Uncharacterized protein n=1 Tax=Melipona bicolor TaxID=60889 RepID=A0AA40G831_9HYME|nr:hypothetical protein K0M31_014070 [Melipona bicolor]
MKNEQDLLIFPWGTNVSRLGDSTTPESTQDDDDDRTIGRLASNDTGDDTGYSFTAVARSARWSNNSSNNNALVATESSDRGNIRRASTANTQLTEAAATSLIARPAAGINVLEGS